MRTPPMIQLAREYLAHRRSLGFDLRIEGAQLMNFARYADRFHPRGPVTLQLALRWARLPKSADPLYWARRLEVIRPFAKYRAAFDPKTEIPPRGYLGAAHRRVAPFIYTQSQIHQLLQAARHLSSPLGLRRLTYATLLGLLACTGLRISEALKLLQADVDLHQGVITVRQSKFQKSRFVPLHPSATCALQQYARKRDACVAADHFFVSEQGTPLPYSTVRGTFRTLVGHTFRKLPPGRRPRLHDLRHHFTCTRLLKWIRQRRQPDGGIVSLSNYLGHKRVTDTYWYFSGIPRLFSRVGTDFERFIQGKIR